VQSPAQFILETPRLIVRQYTIDDAADFFALNSNEEVMRYIRPPKDKKECDAFLAQNINFYNSHPHMGRWATFEKLSKKFVGSFAIIPIDETSNDIQIGYALMPCAWGKGYATELVQYGKNFFFSKHKANVLYALTEQRNLASQKVLLKCGFLQHDVLMEGEKELFRFSFMRSAVKR
jgi:[ribosomal protein S5]-alanine N-acetyltransferase